MLRPTPSPRRYSTICDHRGLSAALSQSISSRAPAVLCTTYHHLVLVLRVHHIGPGTARYHFPQHNLRTRDRQTGETIDKHQTWDYSQRRAGNMQLRKAGPKYIFQSLRQNVILLRTPCPGHSPCASASTCFCDCPPFRKNTGRLSVTFSRSLSAEHFTYS